MNVRIKKFIWGLVTQGIFQITFMVLQIVIAPLLIKSGGAASLGSYAAIMQFVGYLTLLDLGFSSTLTRYLSQSYNDTTDGRKSFINIFNIGRWYLFGACFLMGVVLASLSFVIPESIGLKGEIKYDAQRAMLILAGWYCIRFYFTMFNIVLYATQNMKVANICLTGGIIFRFFLTILFVKLHYNITGIVAANVIGDFSAAFAQMIYFKRKNREIKFSWRIYDKSVFKQLFGFGVNSFLINIATRAFQSSTTFITGILVGAVAAAHYYSMITPAMIIFTFINLIMYNLLPGMNEMVAKGEWETLRKTYLDTLKLKLTILFAAFWGLLLFHRFITVLWVGSAQYEGFYFTAIFACYMVVVTIGSFNENVLIVLGTIKWYARLQITVSVLGILLTLGCGYLYGLKGIVLANLVVLTPTVLYVFYRLAKQLEILNRVRQGIPPIKYLVVVSLVSIAIFFAEKNIVGKINNILLLVGTAVTFLIIMWFTSLEHSQRVQTLKMIKRK